MAKAAILDVLESTIGRYVENLDAQSLNVAVWKGQIELNSLRLDVDAVNHELARKAAEAPNLALPFRVVDGSFENLQVDVPWTRITSKPVVLRASGLNVLIEPFDHLAAKEPDLQEIAKSSEKKREQKLIDDRLKYLDYADEGRQRMNAMREIANIEESIEDHDALDSTSQERNTTSGFKDRLVRRIIENMQLDIDGVRLGLKGNGCSAGIVFSLSIFTTDKDGNQTFVDRAKSSKNPMKSFLNKTLKLKGFGMYCNEDKSPWDRQMARSNVMQRMDSEDEEEERNFILSPLSFEARLRQSDCLKCIDFPKYLLCAEIPSVSIIFTRTQLELLSSVARDITLKRKKSHPLFPEYRPINPISKKTAKLWWKYAVRCVGRVNRRRSWTEFFIAFQKRKTYVSLYKRYVHHSSCSWLKTLSPAELMELQNLDKDRSISVQGIMSWRNIADAQVAYEKRAYEEQSGHRRSHASPKKGPGFSLFGRRSSGNEAYVEFDDEPSFIDMKELEALVNTHSSSEETLSSDSRLCDLRFKLGSFKIDLFTFNSQPLASLDMGAVSTGFRANADGSFDASFSLASLNVYDRITCKSLFPIVVRSLQSIESQKMDNMASAFEVHIAKSKDADTDLSVKLVSFEIIGSTVLMKEMKRFVTPPRDEDEYAPIMSNPILEQTVGGADLFYDADDMVDLTPTHEDISPKNKVKVSDKIASAFADAWDSKIKQETAWKVELDIRAPILVVPHNSQDPLSTVLVVDLGNFNLTYGKGDPTLDVQEWVHSRSIEADYGRFEMTNLSCFIGEVGKREWVERQWLECATKASLDSVEAIIEPITLSLGFAIENDSTKRRQTRKALVGVLPSISFNISYSQIERMVSVASTWLSEIESLTPTTISDAGDEGNAISTNECVEDEGDITTNTEALRITDGEAIDINYISIRLQRLSLRVWNNEGDSIEAHLVSAQVSSTTWSDESTSMRIRMGWFWLLDCLQANYPRTQRLVAHSSLPNSAEFYAERNYEVMKDLEKEGIYEGHDASKKLADITIKRYKQSQPTFGTSGVTIQDEMASIISIDAIFSTLVLHWNPYATRKLLAFKDSFMNFSTKVKSSMNETAYNIIDDKPGASQTRPLFNKQKDTTLIRMRAEMEAFELCLNSAKDDLPLFHLTMSDSKVNVNIYDQDLFSTASIGDLRLEVPSTENIREDYLVLLGLSPTHTTSLLSLEYGKGPLSLMGCNMPGVDRNTTEAYMKVELSPMRFVHIQAQVLTLVEYITEGVLGAIASKVASSAARAAIDLAQSEAGDRIFFVKASGFDFILPEAAYSDNNFILHAGDLFVKYKALQKPGEGECSLKLEEVTMECNREDSVIETPIQMQIDVKLSPLDSPTEDDKAMRVALTFSRAAFVLNRSQYSQILTTLKLNIGEANSFLRDRDSDTISSERNAVNTNAGHKLTHGGAREILIKRRIYMSFAFAILSLQLCDENESDPIISIKAVETEIDLRLFPDTDMSMGKTEIPVTKIADTATSKATSLKLTTSDCSIVFIDVGSALVPGGSLSESTERLVTKGQFEASLKYVSDVVNGSILESDFQLHGERIEVYAAEGKDLIFPVQLLEPTKFSTFLNSVREKDNHSVNLAVVTLTPLQLTVSMQNIAFVLSVVSSLKDVLGKGKEREGPTQDQRLSPDEAAEILQLASELDGDDSSVTDDQSGSHRLESDSSFTETLSDDGKSTRTISCKLTLPDVGVTVVNDLQGLDEALFRIGMRSCVFGLDLSTGVDAYSTMIFRSQMNTTIDADYFISHLNCWKPLLVDNWEVSFKCTRGKSSKFQSSRMSTTIDIESRPCRISICEQFVVGVSATSAMWSVFQVTTQKAMDLIEQVPSASLMKSRAFYAARSLRTTLPYALENHCGLDIDLDIGTSQFEVGNGLIKYFSFHPARYRKYGKDMKQRRAISITIAGTKIHFPHIDDEVNSPKSIHHLGNSLYVMVQINKTGKTTFVQVSSYMSIRNQTNLEFNLSVKLNDKPSFVGTCYASRDRDTTSILQKSLRESSASRKRDFTHVDKGDMIGLPINILQKIYFDGVHEREASIIMSIAHNDLQCEFKLPPLQSLHKMAKSNSTKTFETVCFPLGERGDISNMILQVLCKATLIQRTHPFVEFHIRPRMIIQNEMCMNVLVRTPMPHTYSRLSQQDTDGYERETVHLLGPSDDIEIFTPGNAVAVSVKCADNPVSGTPTDWSNKRGFIDIPLGHKQQLEEDIHGVMPFVNKSTNIHNLLIGSDFLITEMHDTLKTPNNTPEENIPKLQSSQSKESMLGDAERPRTISLSINNLGIDHTGEVLFTKPSKEMRHTIPLGSYSSKNRRITILPHSSAPICLLLLTMEGRGDYLRSVPFRIEDIAICDGGLHSTAIELEGKFPMRYFAYRRLTINNQYEVHIVPEFVIYNGGQADAKIIQSSGDEFILEAKQMISLNRFDREDGLVISFHFLDIDAETSPLRLDTLGLKVVLIKSKTTGTPIGSVPIQTILGALDSRFVIKIGEVNYEGITATKSHTSKQNILLSDFFRFRVRWSELELTVRDTSKDSGTEYCLPLKRQESFPRVARLMFSKVTFDYQRLFKDESGVGQDFRKAKPRSQISMIVGDVMVVDCTAHPEKAMLASTTQNANFLDICIRTKGSNHSKVVSNIDLVHVRLSHDGKTSYPIIICTEEKFLWYLLDISSRIIKATAELSGAKVSLSWDEAAGDFITTVVTKECINSEESVREDGTYRPPRSDRLFAIKKIHISPSSFLVSFKRQPLTSRYQAVKHVRGAKLMHYFTKKLKFTVDNARLEFQGYKLSNMKGPTDRFLENIKAFYVSQLKFKLFNLLTATSLDDWKMLAGREGGSDEYVDGDILRVTGNLAGKSAGYILKKVGQGIGFGVTASTAGIGNGIQDASEVLGIGAVGAGVNSVVSGLGVGVSDTVQGVGSAGSKIVKGAGKGVGQIVGGVGGGLVMAGKGIGTGVATGDGKAVLNGLGDGIVQIGTGIIGGTESVVTGTAGGVYSAGKGLFSGLKSIGKGLEGAVVQKKRTKR